MPSSRSMLLILLALHLHQAFTSTPTLSSPASDPTHLHRTTTPAGGHTNNSAAALNTESRRHVRASHASQASIEGRPPSSPLHLLTPSPSTLSLTFLPVSRPLSFVDDGEPATSSTRSPLTPHSTSAAAMLPVSHSSCVSRSASTSATLLLSKLVPSCWSTADSAVAVAPTTGIIITTIGPQHHDGSSSLAVASSTNAGPLIAPLQGYMGVNADIHENADAEQASRHRAIVGSVMGLGLGLPLVLAVVVGMIRGFGVGSGWSWRLIGRACGLSGGRGNGEVKENGVNGDEDRVELGLEERNGTRH